MSESNLDHPGEFSWYKGRGPSPVVGPCPHVGCSHNAQSVIGWGPTYERYELVQCDVAEHCATGCRAWVDDRGRETTPWLQVEARDDRLLRILAAA